MNNFILYLNFRLLKKNTNNLNIIEKIEKFENIPLLPTNDDEICSICYSKINLGFDKRIKLNCNHLFHKKCITKWLSKKLICPNCNFKINL